MSFDQVSFAFAFKAKYKSAKMLLKYEAEAKVC